MVNMRLKIGFFITKNVNAAGLNKTANGQHNI